MVIWSSVTTGFTQHGFWYSWKHDTTSKEEIFVYTVKLCKRGNFCYFISKYSEVPIWERILEVWSPTSLNFKLKNIWKEIVNSRVTWWIWDKARSQALELLLIIKKCHFPKRKPVSLALQSLWGHYFTQIYPLLWQWLMMAPSIDTQIF